MIKKVYAIYKQDGLIYLTKLILVKACVSTAAFPIALGIAAVSPWISIVFVRLFSSRIGHYAHNTELMLCAMDAGIYKNTKKQKILFYNIPQQAICNTQLYTMWKRVIWICPFPLLINHIDKWLSKLMKQTYANHPLKIAFEGSMGGHDYWGFIKKMPNSHLSFTEKEKKLGTKIMRQLGLIENRPYICLLLRDAGYLETHLPKGDWSYHDYRNVDISQYYKAAEFLANKGFYVVRMGKHVKEKFSVNHPRVIDYANSPLRSDFMDIYLSAHCYFMISTSCGLDSVAQIFRKPVLITDLPLPDIKPYFFWTLLIFKKIYDIKRDQLITLTDAYQEKNLFENKPSMWQAFKEKNWCFIDNTAEEIVAATEEMLSLLENGHQDAHNEPMQQWFWQQFPIELGQESFPVSDITFRIGNMFLKSLH